MLAAGTNEGPLLLFSSGLRQKKAKGHRVLLGHKKRILAIDWNEAYITTAGEDNFVIIWNLQTFSPKNYCELPKQPESPTHSTKHVNMRGSQAMAKPASTGISKDPWIIALKFCLAKQNVILALQDTGYLYEVGFKESKCTKNMVMFLGPNPNFDFDDGYASLLSVDSALRVKVWENDESMPNSPFSRGGDELVRTASFAESDDGGPSEASGMMLVRRRSERKKFKRMETTVASLSPTVC
jgi:WD40 repeat protein